ncbi:MAG TPA: DUF58 domain-containing protein, partial [Kofleriaceae bacterium]|nr:DUF58 domain-containing protein [Kofleriaceae bacterium]
AWTAMRLDLTNDLVEHMVGHRARLAQELPHRRDEEEDRATKDYLNASRGLDHAMVPIAASGSGGGAAALEVEDLVGGRPIDKRCYFLKIPPGKTQRTSYRHTILRRGLHRMEGYRIATRFPFGLFRKSRDVDSVAEILVYPPPVVVTRPPPRARVHGETSAAVVGRRGDFFGLREHRPGDDRRNVHWRSTARSGRVLVREHEDEHTRHITVLVDNALPDDCRGEREPGELLAPPLAALLDAHERAIAVASSLCASYLAAGYVVELVARGLRLTADAGRGQEARIARALALLPAVSSEVEFSGTVSVKRDSVLVAPLGVPACPRPEAATVMEV